MNNYDTATIARQIEDLFIFSGSVILVVKFLYFLCAVLLTLKSKKASEPGKNSYGIKRLDVRYLVISLIMFVVGIVSILLLNELFLDHKSTDGLGMSLYKLLHNEGLMLPGIMCSAFGLIMLPSMITRMRDSRSSTTIIWLNVSAVFVCTFIPQAAPFVYVGLIIWAALDKKRQPAVMKHNSEPIEQQ